MFKWLFKIDHLTACVPLITTPLLCTPPCSTGRGVLRIQSDFNLSWKITTILFVCIYRYKPASPSERQWTLPTKLSWCYWTSQTKGRHRASSDSYRKSLKNKTKKQHSNTRFIRSIHLFNKENMLWIFILFKYKVVYHLLRSTRIIFSFASLA